jgi:hypothetical protein
MGRQFRAGTHFRVELNNPGFVEMRKDAKLVSMFRVRGETWCARLNAELHAAQTARKQPVADGYTFYVHTEGTRVRLYVVAFTARAQAHEKKHSSILKLMETSGYEVKKNADLTPEQRLAGTSARKRSKHDGPGLGTLRKASRDKRQDRWQT